MNKLEEKYKDFEFDEEFPNIYMKVLYDSGGDFNTFSKLLGYTYYPTFINDLTEFELDYLNKFYNINKINI